MPKSETVTLLKSLDRRVGKLDERVEKLDHRVGKLDERVEKLDERVEKLDQRVVNIEQLLPTLATKQELFDGLREEGERSRRYMTMLAEDLRETVNRALDGNIGHTQRLEEHRVRLDGHDALISAVDVRVTTLERIPKRSR